MINQIKIILKPIAVTLLVQSLFMLICSLVALYYKEIPSFFGFIKTFILVLISSVIMLIISNKHTRRETITLRTGFLLVVFLWITVALFGSLPYYLSKSIPFIVNAFFESMSGFTTTGSSIISNVEALPKSILLWRGLTHWLGGGGIVVLSVAILPILGIGGLQIIKAEAPGPKLDKLTPRIAETAKYLWFYYLSLTIIAVILLMLGGMNLLDAVCQATSAISTGGLSTKNNSIAYFNSAYIDWVIILLMFIGGMNFVLVIRALQGKFNYFKIDSEFKAYVGICISAVILVFITNYNTTYISIEENIRYSTFQVVSILSTTGFSTTNYETWPMAAQTVLFILCFIGACSGSTSGNFKVIRYVILFKMAIVEMKYILYPREVFTFRVNNQPVKNDISHAVAGLFIIYILTLGIVTFIISTSGVDIFSSFTAALANIGTIGPGFGSVGPTQNYDFLPSYVKITLAFAMLIGRLEFFTLIIIITPWFWKR